MAKGGSASGRDVGPRGQHATGEGFSLSYGGGQADISYLWFFVVALGIVCAATCDRCMGEVGSSGGMTPVWYHTPEGGVLPACVMRREV